jgi:hypothetical protein
VALTLQQQQQQIYKLESELADLKKERSRLENATKGGVLRKPDPTSPETIQINKKLAATANLIKTKQKELKALNKTLDEAKSDSEVVSEVGSADELRRAALAGYDPDQIQQYRDDLATQLKDKKDKKKAEKAAKKGQTQDRDLTLELKNAGPFVYQTLDGPGRKDLAAQLNAIYGDTNLPISELPSVALKNAYTRLLLDRFQRSLDEGKDLSVIEFMELATVEGTYRNTSELPEPTGTQQIFSRSVAEGVIEDIFSSLNLGEASKSQIDSLYKQLQAEQKKLSSISKSTYKMVNGRRVVVQKAGLDPRTFLENKIKELPIYTKSQAAKSEKNRIDLASTALANGYNLETDFAADLPNWLDAINKGKSIDEFKNKIRKAARRILPEAIRNQIDEDEDLSTTFSTYISNIARARNLPISAIKLNDVIPLAITDKGFADSQQFEVNKRSQAWWDSSPEGISITTTFLNDTLKDWGMLGQGVRTA